MTLAGEIRDIARQLQEFTSKEICSQLDFVFPSEKKRVWKNLRDFERRGEVERIAPGQYRYLGRKITITLRQRYWDIARRMVRFSLDDLEQITESNRKTIKEFCCWMVNYDYAQRVRPGHFKVTQKLGPIVPKYNKHKVYINES
jgi:hypothetical protein